MSVPAATLDYPHIRKAHVCPLCFHSKPIGNVTCWACYGRLQLRYGTPASVTERLDMAEARKRNLERAPLVPGWINVEGGARTAEQWDAQGFAHASKQTEAR